MTKLTVAVLVTLFLAIAIFSSCGNVRELQYFQGAFDTAKLSQIKYPEPVFQKNDLVSILVYSDDPRASAYYNLPASTTISNTVGASSDMSAGGGGLQSGGASYLVDETGNIQFPGLGNLEVAGLTKDQLYKLLEAKLQDKLSHPYFIIRFTSYKITMLGEVARPGIFTIPNERVSLIEALAIAGDLTVYGRRENVLIIRELNGVRTWHRIDLRSPDIVASPYFYLQPNDVVYVDLNKTKASANDAVVVRNISLGISIISLLIVIISISQ
jgi:polysaccharide export outer membrane protein